jgi:isopenicillin N synthase-like dioxygenase
MENVPVIDITGFRLGTEADKKEVARQFDKACVDVGFIVIKGHGIPDTYSETTFETARAFFDLSEAQKLAVKKAIGGAGYHPFATEANAFQTGQITPEDLRESFGLGRPDRRSGAHNKWPAAPADLQSTATSYYSKVEQLGYLLTSIFAVALDLPADYFDDKVSKHDSMLLLHHYPQQKIPPLPGQVRSGEHTDAGLFTMLRTERQNRPGGLQVLNRSKAWVDVPAIEDSFIINIGDTMMRWTNDRWISNLHRVVNPPLDSGEESRRISMPFFFAANDDAIIECLPTCCSADNPPKYKPVQAGAYRHEKLKRTYLYAQAKAEGKLEELLASTSAAQMNS